MDIKPIHKEEQLNYAAEKKSKPEEEQLNYAAEKKPAVKPHKFLNRGGQLRDHYRIGKVIGEGKSFHLS